MIATLLFAGALAAAPCTPGALVIAGGALAADNAAIRAPLIASAGAEGRIAIIPAASQAPSRSPAAFAADLARDGFPSERVDLVRLAVEDDLDTPDLDERAWAGNAADPQEIAKVEAASAIWFVGGDQSRLTRVLLTEGGEDTPLLAAIRARSRCGAAVGGTSAGAAIMSLVMITGGDSLSALTRGVQRPGARARRGGASPQGEALQIAPGLGLLALGLVDQHFSQRGRLGRLVRALSQEPAARRIGFGIDENTALVVDQRAGIATVAGAGHVVVVDARAARLSASGAIAAVEVSWLGPGDQVRLDTLAVAPAAGKTPVDVATGSGAERAPEGIAAPAAPLADHLLDGLFGSGAPRALERISFAPDGAGAILRFSKQPRTTAFEGSGPPTIVNLRLDVTPARVRIEARP